jgi:hypothetical protein
MINAANVLTVLDYQNRVAQAYHWMWESYFMDQIESGMLEQFIYLSLLDDLADARINAGVGGAVTLDAMRHMIHGDFYEQV